MKKKYVIKCETCGHEFYVPEISKNLDSKNPARRLPAKARLKAFHWYHKVAKKHCECHKVCDK